MQNWLIDFVDSTGVFGVALLMFLENIVPPIPSELIMPLAGYLAATEGMSIGGAIAAGTAGSLAGATLWYVLGRRIDERRFRTWADRHGAWVAMTSEDIDRGSDWFERHRGRSVFFGRLIPVLRTVISVPAGFSDMRLVPFLLYSLAGTAIWSGALALAGHELGRRFPQVEDCVGPVTWLVIAAAFAWYIRGVIRKRRKS